MALIRAVSALGRKTALSVGSRGTTLGETLEPFICVIDKDPVAVVGLSSLNMGKVVLNRRRLKVGNVGQPANVHPNRRRTITKIGVKLTPLTLSDTQKKGKISLKEGTWNPSKKEPSIYLKI